VNMGVETSLHHIDSISFGYFLWNGVLFFLMAMLIHTSASTVEGPFSSHPCQHLLSCLFDNALVPG
jgi:hypothetical protein